jgi:hypothetical protein
MTNLADHFQSTKPAGVLDMSIVVLAEAATIASSLPYMSQVASIFLLIVKIKAVRFSFLLDRLVYLSIV